MEYRTFWTLTPAKLKIFMRAFREKEQRELERANFVSWLGGLYVAHAMASVLSERHAYPKEALPLFGDEAQKTKQKVNEADLFDAYAAVFNKRFEQKKEE